MIQALNDLVLESLVSFAFVRFPRLYLALFGVFSSQCIFVFWEISFTSFVCRIQEGSVYPWCHRKTKLLCL